MGRDDKSGGRRRAKTPMGRAGQPAELAPLYVLLADNSASYTTGQIVGATGGEGGP
jgi:NAD(P)-dependent dehydrogenase (short-subunit alcohol dehydrogenase family)